MVKKKKSQLLHLLMNGFQVGELEKTAQGGLKFTYHKDWLNQAGARPVSLYLSVSKSLNISRYIPIGIEDTGIYAT